jgi:omega-6 fatty acid desaturase (delta-12 desaturase)
MSRSQESYYSTDKIKEMKSVVNQYHASEFTRPSFYLITTFLGILAVLYLIIYNKKNKIPLTASIILLALFLLRLFMIFHDMCHRSYFPSTERKTNTNGLNFIIAQCIEGFNLFEASHWNKIHSAHHKAHGNLNLYDSTRTVFSSEEYNKMPQYKRVLYDVFRNPILFFLFGPLYIFWICKFLNHEWSFLLKYSICLGLLYRVGSCKLLFAFLAAQYFATILGLMLFHLQHQVNVGFWERFPKEDELSKDNAELRGSSVLKIPWGLDYFSNGIEYHNVHHLDPGVPSYNTRACYDDLVARGMIPDRKIGYVQAFKSLFHVIYNEKTKRYESSSFFKSIGLQG